MFRDECDLERIPHGLDDWLAREPIYYHPAMPLDQIPPQRCGDDEYIQDRQVLGYYRNLSYEMIRFMDYENPIIGVMVTTACWLVTSMSEQGMLSPLNIQGWNNNVHPGIKRYIVAHYLQFDAVPVLWQGPERTSKWKINCLRNLEEIYGRNISVKLRQKDHVCLEVSSHSESNWRDPNGYDFWVKAALEDLGNQHKIFDYVRDHGLNLLCDVPGYTINNADVFRTHASRKADQHDFYLEIPDAQLLEKDLWQLYFHFDPRVGLKTCPVTGIKIVNKLGDPNWQIEVDLARTLDRPWLSEPEKQ